TSHRRHSRKAAAPSIEMEIHQMREDLQSQIDELKIRLSAKDAEIAALQRLNQTAQDKAATATAQAQTIDRGVHQNVATVNALQSSVTNLQAQSTSVSTRMQQVQEKLQKNLDEPVALHYKGITIVPGGFLAGESIWRQRAMNADIYTNFNATPYMNSGEAHTSEWVPTARQSRLSTLFSGKVPFGTLNG